MLLSSGLEKDCFTRASGGLPIPLLLGRCGRRVELLVLYMALKRTN